MKSLSLGFSKVTYAFVCYEKTFIFQIRNNNKDKTHFFLVYFVWVTDIITARIEQQRICNFLCKKLFSSWGKTIFGNASIPLLLFIICLNRSNYAYNKLNIRIFPLVSHSIFYIQLPVTSLNLVFIIFVRKAAFKKFRYSTAVSLSLLMKINNHHINKRLYKCLKNKLLNIHEY